MEAQNSTIAFESEKGNGTTFTITTPNRKIMLHETFVSLLLEQIAGFKQIHIERLRLW